MSYHNSEGKRKTSAVHFLHKYKHNLCYPSTLLSCLHFVKVQTAPAPLIIHRNVICSSLFIFANYSLKDKSTIITTAFFFFLFRDKIKKKEVLKKNKIGKFPRQFNRKIIRPYTIFFFCLFLE